ncbi:MAG: cytochrome c [bacterium]|nr:cytochrome c [bacterium]
MDFPIFHIDFFGNRMLIAGIAIVHVIINHGFAVGAMPLVAAMEWWGWRTGERRWDDLARRYLWVCFIVTTTVGALTGVGIWFSTSLVNPYAIGSLIRVFFWAWFAEWVVFVTEVCLILAYFLLWKRWDGERKLRHIRLGIALSVASWLTMAIIVAILGYMMNPGAWLVEHRLVAGIFNPIYLPQLAFRTPMAMVMAGALALFLNLFFTAKGSELRHRGTRFVAVWLLVWLPLFCAGALWYRLVIPRFMAEHFSVALGTMQFQNLYSTILWLTGLAFSAIVLVALWGGLRPTSLPRWAWALPMVMVIALTAQFERAREFIRKPYVLGGYIYANGIRVSDYPLLMKEGLLANSTFVSEREVTADNRLRAGKDVFMVACSRCHTLNGINSVPGKLEAMYGKDTSWSPEAVDQYLASMFAARPFMPPFPGTVAERRALAEYLVSLRTRRDVAAGAQTAGIASAR